MPAPTSIAIVDDVLTTGAHCRASRGALGPRFPTAAILGLFRARRVPGAVCPVRVSTAGSWGAARKRSPR